MSRTRHAFWIRNGPELTPSDAVELAVAAEEGGWDGVFLSDAVVEGHTEPLVQLAAIAARTRRIHLGTWVVPLPARDALTVARQAAAVEDLAPGRLVLGLGLGNEVEHTSLGVSRERLGEHLDASLEVLASLLEGETVTRHDAWFDLDEVRLHVPPKQRPPLLMGATWPARAPLRRAGRWDGTAPFWRATADGRETQDDPEARAQALREAVEYYREQAAPPGTVLVPRVSSWGEDWDDLLAELEVDWVLTCDTYDADDLRAGPPR